MKNRYHYVNVVENARLNFSVSPYCTLLFSRKEVAFEVALPAVLYNGTVGYMFEDISIEILPMPLWTFTCFLKNSHKTTQTRCKVCSNLLCKCGRKRKIKFFSQSLLHPVVF